MARECSFWLMLPLVLGAMGTGPASASSRGIEDRVRRNISEAETLLRSGQRSDATISLEAAIDDVATLPLEGRLPAARPLLSALGRAGATDQRQRLLRLLLPADQLDLGLEELETRLQDPRERKALALLRSHARKPGREPGTDPRVLAALRHLDAVRSPTSTTRYLRGLCRLQAGAVSPGVKELRAAVAADPADPLPRLALARVSQRLGRGDRSLFWLRPPDGAAPSRESIAKLAGLLEDLGSRGEAEALPLAFSWLEKLPADEAVLPLARFASAASLDHGDPAKAWTAARRILKESPDRFAQVPAFQAAGRALARRSPQDRLEVLKECADGSASNPLALRGLIARIHVDAGNADHAIQAYLTDPSEKSNSDKLVQSAQALVQDGLATPREVAPGVLSAVSTRGDLSLPTLLSACSLTLDGEQPQQAAALFRRSPPALQQPDGAAVSEKDLGAVMGLAGRLVREQALEATEVREIAKAPVPADASLETLEAAAVLNLDIEVRSPEGSEADQHFIRAADHYASLRERLPAQPWEYPQISELQARLGQQGVRWGEAGLQSDAMSPRSKKVLDSLAHLAVKSRTDGAASDQAVMTLSGASLWYAPGAWSRAEKEGPTGAPFLDARQLRFLEMPIGTEPPREALLRNYMTGNLARFFEELPGSAGFMIPGGGTLPVPADDALKRAQNKVLQDGLTEHARFARVMEVMPEFPDPIVLDLDGNGKADLTPADDPARGVWFDLGGQGSSQRVQWLEPGHDGWLCEDVNRDGAIDSGLELFGSAGGYAHGFAKLATRDLDRDMFIDGKELDGLTVWVDRDGDGRTSSGELVPAREMGIDNITVPRSGLSSTAVKSDKVIACWDVFPQVFAAGRLASR